MKYEVMFLFKPISVEDVRDKVLPKIEKKISDLGGIFALTDFMGKRLLAYKIQGFKEGIYVLGTIEISQTNINELRNFLRFSPDLLRFLIIKLGKNK